MAASTLPPVLHPLQSFPTSRPRRRGLFLLLRVLVAVGLAVPCVLPADALAQGASPFEAKQRRLAAQAERQGRDAVGILPLLELWHGWDDVPPEVTRTHLLRLERSPRLSPARRVQAGVLLAQDHLRAGELDQSRKRMQSLGYITSWRVVGPFDNEGKAGFDQAMGPEQSLTEPVAHDAAWRGKERAVRWRSYPALSYWLGYVDFDAVFRPDTQACSYAETFVTSERAQPLTLWAGAGGAIKVWWNGELVISDAGYRQPDPDRSVAVVGAHEGPNRVLVKVCVDESAWGFYLRMGDAQGGALVLGADPDATDRGPAGHAAVRLPAAPQAPMAALGEAARAERARAADLENFARFLSYTGADDPAEHLARQLAARAADLQPTVDRLHLAAALADQRGDIMRFVDRAQGLAPRDPKVQLMRAQVLASGHTSEDALPLLRRMPSQDTTALEAALLEADILADFGLSESALRIVERVAARMPGTERAARALAGAMSRVGHQDGQHELHRSLARLRYDDLGMRRTLLADALRRQDTAEVLEHLGVLRTLASTPAELVYVAHVHEALGQEAEALEALQQAMGLAPEDAGTLVTYGELMLRIDQTEAAAEAFRKAIVLKPQDRTTRELLEQIEKPPERPDERFAVGERELLERRTESSGYPSTLLQQLTVNTVFENGLGSTFHQVAAQVHDEEGARQWRTYPIRFDPISQRVRVRQARVYRNGRVLEARRTFVRQLGEPWYRIYYDTRALVVVFPTLQPGDVVELRYRVDDMAHRNLFADYFGDLTFAQSMVPMRHFDYVLITPKKRELHWHASRMEGLKHTREVVGDERIDRYTAREVPAARSEKDMPGMTEISPFLHVSTYRGWEDMGRWYWGLIKDQLYADESLQKTVRELVAGARSEREKVSRIHRWVLDNTRYVGLEFGIHGFKPYRVPQIVRRGFGDCKDKASLLYTMFREAGIDAHFVLLRTRRNGLIPDLPASLAVFDHAIAYVPSLDLYLDGTAEHSGSAELPEQDQGAVVLHVWPGGSELRRTPVLPAERNRRTRTLDATLAADGSATVRERGEVRGGSASFYRSRYQAEGTRKERFERSMRGTFPGMELKALSFQSLADIEEPVRFEYEARVPQLAQRDGGALRMAGSTLEDLVRSYAPTASRQHPLDLGSTTSYVEERTITLPNGLRPSVVPDGGEVRSEFGSLVVRISHEGQRVKARTEFELVKDRVEPKQYPAFRRWVEKADALLRQRFHFEEVRR
jgi:cellulose synthase operon protein C